MLYMVCRNRVADYAKWREVFEEHAEAHRAAGLVLRHVWRDSGRRSQRHFHRESKFQGTHGQQ